MQCKKNCYGCLLPKEDEHNGKPCKEKYPAPIHAYIPNNRKVTGDVNQSENDEEEDKINLTDDVKCVSTLGKSGSNMISMLLYQ